MIKQNLHTFWAKLGIGAVAFLLTSGQINAAEVHIGVARLAKQTDAMKATDSESARLMTLISPSLLGGGKDAPEGYALAKNVSRNAAADVYTVALKKGLKTHAGESVDAAYVSNYYAKLKESVYGQTLSDVSDIFAQDALTIVFKLNNSNPWFSSALNLPIAETGPYKVSKTTATEMVVTPVLGVSPTLVFNAVENPMVRYLKLQRGEVDILHNDLPSEIFTYGEEKGMNAVAVPSASYTYIGLQIQRPPFNDVRVRKALSLAINRQALEYGLLANQARPAHSLLLENEFGFWPAPEDVYNPKAAKKLLADVGYTPDENGIYLHMRLNITSNPLVQRMAQALQQNLKLAGIDMQIEAREWGSFYRDVKKGNFEAYILSWVGPFTGDFYNYLFNSAFIPPEGLNRGRVFDVHLDVLLEQMMKESDTEKRQQLLEDIQKYQYQNMLYVPLWRGHHLSLTAPYVHGYMPTNDGGFMSLTTVTLQK